MKILVVGGAGMIGGDAALHLAAQGHDVTIAGRTPPVADTPLAQLPFERVDYVKGEYNRHALRGFDALVFTAGNDVRHIPEGQGADYWKEANSKGIPRFFEAAKAAGIKVAINVGSYYPQVAPQLVATNPYVESRKLSDDGVTALSDENFRAMSINAPFVLGHVPGLDLPMFAAYVQYAEGKMAPMPDFAPPGGTNFISTRSLATAIEGALKNGEGGASYLVGDQNMTFQDYFGTLFEAVGREKPPVRDEEHPLLPDSAIFWGRGGDLYYDPPADVVERLGYRRNDVVRALQEIAANYAS
ncbi:NAD(P)-dependent oxidoreductase [Croceicoccus sp. F390]|uniref:NAD(P)-dependent oxidoreductase n=1 Tax=Croceicoccus esteveae TaxID=3075597 RepID=A0ABU2ZH61_9SPHN|nr:NAD(P)-dependent oxidoreductase [Croceicoccus sp. F390]MDT0574934.1 NAD(P)-dependent oxidoreductase [Croceicoccus sp. F390]